MIEGRKDSVSVRESGRLLYLNYFRRVELSFWEKTTFFRQADALIIGSGIVGLNTARALKEKYPSWRIVVIDRGILPYGASTRNAGFACFGSLGELVADRQKMSEDELFTLIERRYKGLLKLREVVGDSNMDYEPLGGYEVFRPEDQAQYGACIAAMEYFNHMLKDITGSNVYCNTDHLVSSFGLKGIDHLLFNAAEGQIDTGKMMQALLQIVRNAGVEVYNGISIRNWSETEQGVILETGEGFSLQSKRMIVCTNGFAQQLLPALQVEPGRAQVLITSPINDLRVKGSFHLEDGYYYFRNVGDRILFGGGRNLDFDRERTTDFGLTALVQQRLEEILKEIILPSNDYAIEQRWSGIMGLGPTKTTIVRQLSDNIYCAVRMGGMGVAIGTLVGEECAAIVNT